MNKFTFFVRFCNEIEKLIQLMLKPDRNINGAVSKVGF